MFNALQNLNMDIWSQCSLTHKLNEYAEYTIIFSRMGLASLTTKLAIKVINHQIDCLVEIYNLWYDSNNLCIMSIFFFPVCIDHISFIIFKYY